MDAHEKYCEKIRREEVEVLKGYEHFLSVFYNSLKKVDSLDVYGEMDNQWMKRLRNIRKVMDSLGIESLEGERDRLLEKSRGTLKKIALSLDTMRGSLHDDICSLNKKNCRMGLRYNRYSRGTADPGIIDITT